MPGHVLNLLPVLVQQNRKQWGLCSEPLRCLRWCLRWCLLFVRRRGRLVPPVRCLRWCLLFVRRRGRLVPPVRPSIPVLSPPGMAGHPCLTLRARSLSLQGDPANIGKGCSRPARCTRGAGDRFGISNPRKSGSVIGADRQRLGPSCVLLKRVPQGRTESGGIELAANAGPRVPSGGVTLKRRCVLTNLQSSI